MEKNDAVITKAIASDVRFNLKKGEGSDAVNTDPQYAYAVCRLSTDNDITGIGLAFTLGIGNELVCKVIEYLCEFIEGKEIEALMAEFGTVFRKMSNVPNLRWLGPHKGVIHLALASVTNACYDLWAKSRGVPLWNLLINLSAEAIVDTLDLSYVDEVLTRKEALNLLRENTREKVEKEHILRTGYPGYDTSVGWFNYSDSQIREEVKKSIDQGFTAMKLKVGSANYQRDLRRARLIRETAGDKAILMLDANQRWSLPEAVEFCQKLDGINPYWIEEPTHPDDVSAHVKLGRKISPLKLAMGEHIPNRILFKNFMQSGAMSFNQVDAVRVGGISEFITISLMSKKFDIPVVPHVGDMGQIHQHLVLFNHVRVGHEVLFLEYIPHLKDHFTFPVTLKDGFYQVPQEPGMSADLTRISHK